MTLASSVTLRALIPEDQMLIAPDAVGIRANLAKALQDKPCADYIKEILSRVASDKNPLVEGGDLLKIFDVITGPGQRGLERGVKFGAAQAFPSVRQGTAGIGFGIFIAGTFPVGGGALRQALLQSDSNSALDELMHLAGQDNYSDQRLAQAASKLREPGTPELKEIPFPEGDYTDPKVMAARVSWVFHYSGYFHPELRKRCKNF
jgi:hypothetical protein